MGLGTWLLVGGALLATKKALENNSNNGNAYHDEYDELTAEERAFLQEAREFEHKNDKRLTEERIKTPCFLDKGISCFFSGGISKEDFVTIANNVAGKIDRITEVSVLGAVVFCTVESQTGYTSWQFCVDYNNWGYVTGRHWIISENDDSKIAEHFAKLMDKELEVYSKTKKLFPIDFNELVETNPSIGLPETLECHLKPREIKKKFGQIPTFSFSFDSKMLSNEHLFPILSLLKLNGIINYKCIPIKDVGEDSGRYVYEVDHFEINGNSYFHRGEEFSSETELLIYYHDKLAITPNLTSKNFKKRNYLAVAKELNGLGFSSDTIYFKEIKDLRKNSSKNGDVENVYISSNEFCKNSTYVYDEKIIIEYHSSR